MNEVHKMINVIGLGYIGLPTALMLAASGQEIVGTDYNPELVQTLNAGETTFEEQGLKALFTQAVNQKMVFTTDYVATNMYIVTVPTPYEKENKKIDPSYIIQAVESIMEVCEKKTILVIESTVSPGTIDKYIRPIVKLNMSKTGKIIHLVHAPERILPGNMIEELKYNSRTIGADDEKIGLQVKAVYQSFCKADIVVTDIRTAEMTKVVENTYRDINIAFANELTKICRSDNLDVHKIINIANMHPRVNILNPGPGVGGHCISVDPWFLVGDYPGLANIILTAREINDSMPEHVLERIYTLMEKHQITDVTKIGLYGLTYKPDVDDIRESPTLQLIEKMEKHLATPLKVYDPMLTTQVIDSQLMDFEKFLAQTELIVIMVAHTHIKENTSKLANKVVLDTQNMLEDSYKL